MSYIDSTAVDIFWKEQVKGNKACIVYEIWAVLYAYSIDFVSKPI